MTFIKFLRTPHLEGSLQSDGDNLKLVPFNVIFNSKIVVSEKVDGTNIGIRFIDHLIRFQRRGNYLTGGPSETEFDLLKSWAYNNFEMLHTLLGKRYIMFGEWCYAQHTVPYNALPHYFLEFDIYDTYQHLFLSEWRRSGLLSGSPIHSVNVLYRGRATSMDDLLSLITTSGYGNCDMEGVVVKVDGVGKFAGGRYKYVRQSFIDSISVHWSKRPMVVNGRV